MAKFVLSAELRGHDSDVRSCVGVDNDRVVTASRDTRVTLWKREAGSERVYESERMFSGHAHFVNAVAVLSPRLLASGSADKTVRVWDMESGTCLAVLAEHSGSVCALTAVAGSGEMISCSWDFTARLWSVQSSAEGGEVTGSCKAVYSGHEAAVWDALSIESTVITASADKTIKIWAKDSGAPLATLTAHNDAVRSLAPAPSGGFVSVSNDGDMRHWAPSGESFVAVETVRALHDDQFIYTVAAFPSSQVASGLLFVSGGEDNNARVVGQAEDGTVASLATIPHPGTVWSVAVTSRGDVFTGCSDGVARIFTLDPERQAPEDLIAQYESELASRQVSTKLIGGVDVAKLPDAEAALSRPGNKDGQNLIVRRGNVAEVHMWSAANEKWTKVGDVVDGPGKDGAGPGGGDGGADSGGGVVEGRYYDFVFDVEVGESGPRQKLGYNRGENPYTAAQRFIDQNELNQDFLDQIASFIEQQVGSDNRVVARATPASDPFTGANRYVPGTATAGGGGGGAANTSPFTPGRYTGGAQAPPPAAQKHVPVTQLVTFKTTDQQEKIKEKLLEFNGKLAGTGNELSSEEIEKLTGELVPQICKGGEDVAAEAVDKINRILLWPADMLIPAVDLAAEGTSPGVLLLASRFFCNMCMTESGKAVMDVCFDDILSKVRQACAGSSNRRVRETYACLLLDLAVSFPGDPKLFSVVEAAVNLTMSEKEEAVLYRAMTAIGTALSNSKEASTMAQETGVAEAAANAAPASGRLTECANEVAQLLFK